MKTLFVLALLACLAFVGAAQWVVPETELDTGALRPPTLEARVEGKTTAVQVTNIVETVVSGTNDLLRIEWKADDNVVLSNSVSQAQAALLAYSNHVHLVYIRAVEVESGVFELYLGE